MRSSCSGEFPARSGPVASLRASSCHASLRWQIGRQAGRGWLHEIKFDGYRVIAARNGEQVRLWARTTSDYSKAFGRIRDAVAALPVENAVIDGEAIVLRPDNTSDFEALRSGQGQVEAILVAAA